MATTFRAIRGILTRVPTYPSVLVFVGYAMFLVALVLLVVAACAPRTTPVAPPAPVSGGVVASTWATPPATPVGAPREPSVPSAISPSAISATPVIVATPAVQVPARAVPSPAAGDARFAVLLLGYGGPGHDGEYLTDSVMVVIVDPNLKTLTLVSFPRDSWVPLEFDGETPTYNKLNTAYAFAHDPTMGNNRLDRYAGSNGPGRFAADTVARVLGVPITYYLGLDFQGFRQMVDAVGGISVAVPDSFTARYPANDDANVDPSWMTVRFYRGQQWMNGERAIEFARAREVSDNPAESNDFARSRRQRLIIEAFKARLFEPGGLLHMPQILSIASHHVDTDYGIPALTQLSTMLLDWKDVRIYQTALSTDNYLVEGTGPDGAYVLVPSGPDHSWAQIRAFARRLWVDPLAGLAMASTKVVVVNRSGSPGLAARVSASLSVLGYQVGNPESGTDLGHSRLIDRTGGKGAAMLQNLTTDLGLANPDVLSEGSATSDEIVVELGADASGISVDVPMDVTAPTSAVGLQQVGDWSPSGGASSSESDATATPADASSSQSGSSVPGSKQRATPPPRPIPLATPIPVSGNTAMVLVPRLVGLPESAAEQMINQSDLMTTYVNYQTIDQVADHAFFLSISPGAVLSQFPPAGTQVARGTRILLAVRKV